MKHLDDDNDDSYASTLDMFADKLFRVSIKINVAQIQMLWDSGSVESLVSYKLFTTLQRPATKVQSSKRTLKSYTNQPIPVHGTAMVEVKFMNKVKTLNIVIVEMDGPSLFGWNWMKEFEALPNICSVSHLSLNTVLERYKSVFDGSLGKVKNRKIRLTLKEGTQPRVIPSRPVPFALRDLIEKDLERLEKEGIITKVSTSEWASPIVPVKKSNGTIRICGDYKVSVNQAL